jgi:DNA-binding winged helix-turn-helix (wHTH) protein
MQVLVALAEAQGRVLTRDELIERCWGGIVVGDNAINRVISRIRQIASDFGMDSFQLETITKVGYRMVVPARFSRDPPMWTRRERRQTDPPSAAAG